MSARDGAAPVVGFVGLGDQGAPIARAIAEQGYELHVWARRPASLRALAGVPFVAHDDLADLGGAVDIAAVCLNLDDDVRAVLIAGGLLDALRPGSILVNHGTGLPSFAQEVTALAAPHGVDVLDAPVSGGRAGAVARSLTTIVGGPTAAVARCRPVFATFSTAVTHLGGAGAGQTAKLLNDALLMANQDNIAELLRAARGLGVAVAPLVGLIRTGTGSSRALELLGTAITPGNAEHLREMQLVDMEIFVEAVAALSDDVQPFTDRAVRGAQVLPDLAEQIR